MQVVVVGQPAFDINRHGVREPFRLQHQRVSVIGRFGASREPEVARAVRRQACRESSTPRARSAPVARSRSVAATTSCAGGPKRYAYVRSRKPSKSASA